MSRLDQRINLVRQNQLSGDFRFGERTAKKADIDSSVPERFDLFCRIHIAQPKLKSGASGTYEGQQLRKDPPLSAMVKADIKFISLGLPGALGPLKYDVKLDRKSTRLN